MPLKRCACCKVPKETSAFNRNRSMRDGLSPYCRVCDNARWKVYIAERPPKTGTESKSSVWFRKLKTLVIVAYGAKCICCGEEEFDFLTLDHVNGGGGQHRINSGSNAHYTDARRREFPSDYRVLCYNCNCCRAHKGYCPHEKERAAHAA